MTLASVIFAICHMVGNGPLTRDSGPPHGCGQDMNRGNIYSVGDRSLVREDCPPYGDTPSGFGCGQSGMTKSDGDAWIRLSDAGYSQLKSGFSQPLGLRFQFSAGLRSLLRETLEL